MTASTETPEQIGDAICGRHSLYIYEPQQPRVSADIAAAIREAVAAEREACAKVVDPPDGEPGPISFTRTSIAAAIRERRP